MQSSSVCLVSSCLAGLRTRYDGEILSDLSCREVWAGSVWIPVCPEQLGGLATPRVPADIVGGNGFDVLAGRARVLDRQGRDVTENFIGGAEQVLEIGLALRVTKVFLKARSPSCGVHGHIGVTAALLKSHGFSLKEF